MESTLNKMILSRQWEDVFDRTDILGKQHENIPFLKLPSDISFKAVPPYTGASVRYLLKKGDKQLSVYLDIGGFLGYYYLGDQLSPYWEVYDGEETYRFKMEDGKGLQNCIIRLLKGESLFQKIKNKIWK